MVHPKLVPSLLLVGALAFGVAITPARAQVNLGSGVVINDINIDPADLELADGVLQLVDGATGTVSGTIAGLPFTTTITDLAINLIPDNPATPGTECSVLHLALAPIHLSLLGAFVDTSPICLNITAIEGGGLLGDLLCSVAGGDGLSDLIRGLLLGDLLDALGGTDGLLTQALNQGLAAQPSQQDPQTICRGATEVLHLVVGPVDLTLLGLHVRLDDCDDGPVEVCVSATAGAGLLGDLLAGLAGGNLLGGIDLGGLNDLLGTILGALPTGGVNATAKQVNQLVKDAGHALRDGQLSRNELSNITKSVQKLVRKA